MLFERTTAPDRLMHTDLGHHSMWTDQDREAFFMQQALKESAQRMADLLTEAGISPEDIKHLNPNKDRPNIVADELGWSV